MCIQLSYNMEGTDFTLAMIRPRIERITIIITGLDLGGFVMKEFGSAERVCIYLIGRKARV